LGGTDPDLIVTSHQYGEHPAQAGELYFLPGARGAAVCLLHGGYWRARYGRDQLDPVARRLASQGFRVWNASYRRIGETGGGWPGTFEDIGQGLDCFATALGVTGTKRLPVFAIGHSAGGHLALWSPHSGSSRTRIVGIAGLAAVSDLLLAFGLNLSNGAARELLGTTPQQDPERYRNASPLERLPLRIPQLLIHGTADDAVPVIMSRQYAERARERGDTVELIELQAMGHMEFLDPQSRPHALLEQWLLKAGKPYESGNTVLT